MKVLKTVKCIMFGDICTYTYSYDMFGNNIHKYYNNMLTDTYEYNVDNVCLSVLNDYEDITYKYDDSGNIINIIHDGEYTDILTYDDSGNLVEEYNSITSSYIYYEYDGTNVITIEGEDFRCDNEYDGNLLIKEIYEDYNESEITIYTYEYDDSGKIISRTNDGHITQYEYDLDGDIIKTISDIITDEYIYEYITVLKYVS